MYFIEDFIFPKSIFRQTVNLIIYQKQIFKYNIRCFKWRQLELGKTGTQPVSLVYIRTRTCVLIYCYNDENSVIIVDIKINTDKRNFAVVRIKNLATLERTMKKVVHLTRYFCTRSDAAYTAIPKYPEILDLSPEATKARERQKRVDKLNALNTVEEKLYAVNLDKYYGWNSLILREGEYPCSFLPFVKRITRTFLVEANIDLFHQVQQSNVSDYKIYVDRIRPYVQEAILFEYDQRSKITDKGLSQQSGTEEQNFFSNAVLQRINEILLSSLSTEHPHLLESMVDYEPRLETFWLVGNFCPSDELYKERVEKNLSEEEINEPVEHWIQYFGKPTLQLRTDLPLPPLDTTKLEQYNNSNLSEIIQDVNYDPSLAYALSFDRRHGTNIPGFWPGDKNEFGLLSYHLCGHLVDRPPQFGNNEHRNTIHAQAILAGFGWLHGQACYQGFTTYTELTYPLVSQNVISDGQNFSFYLYQLNTMLYHSNNLLKNTRANVCVYLPTCQLYKEIKGSEFFGWDDSVLSTLISFYLNKPQEREQDLKPFVNPAESHISAIEDTEKRVWLHKHFKYMYSNRPRTKLPYEIYDWEKIYKIKFETRPMEARLRPFERDENPIEERKYYEHMHEYIPKKFRSKKKHWTGWRAKFAKTFYPDV